jgi:hypothetical protein
MRRIVIVIEVVTKVDTDTAVNAGIGCDFVATPSPAWWPKSAVAGKRA